MHFVRDALSQIESGRGRLGRHVVVIGIGQSMRGDDSAGLEAVRLWQRTHAITAARADIRVETTERPGPELLEALDGVQGAVLVDALRSGMPAGTLHRCGVENMSAFENDSRSVHGWGVAETLRVGRLLYPERLTLPIRVIGIEPQEWALGSPLSRVVAQALPQACEAIQEEVEALLNE